MKKLVPFVICFTLLLSSCTWLREKKAEHHQPFKPHKAKKGHKHHHH